jgi:DNA (cytosine-5)-methyltransferase 1
MQSESDRRDAAIGRGLDLFCGAGGAGVGYSRLGFEMVGVDIANQPRYPFTFVRADALDFLASPWIDFSAFSFIHASPPCQHYSDLAYRNGNADEHPDLIGRVRELLEASGLPYVIENVEGSPLDEPTVVCGTPLGLGVGRYRLRRHRLFEMSFPHRHRPDCFCTRDERPIIDVSGGGPTHAPRLDGGGGRTYKGTVAEKREAMGIDWMTGAELVEAIPPAYTEQRVGIELLAHLYDTGRIAA